MCYHGEMSQQYAGEEKRLWEDFRHKAVIGDTGIC
jgi:hypothetical protein